MPNPRLMVIEDNPDVAKLVCHIAAIVGFAARAVIRGGDVIPAYDEFDPQVIVLDILMPEMDGFEILQFLHARKSEAHVVILSGDTDFRPMAEHLADGLHVDVAANLAKPFRAQELISTLETIKFSLTAPEAKITA